MVEILPCERQGTLYPTSQFDGCQCPSSAKKHDINTHGIHLIWNIPVSTQGWLKHHFHDNVIKWKHFLHYRPFVQRIHWSPVNSLHKGQWCGALMVSLICAWINRWVNTCEAGDLRLHCAHYDIIVMNTFCEINSQNNKIVVQIYIYIIQLA